MSHTEKYIPRFVVLRFQIVLHKFRKGAIASLVALNDLTAFLIYDNDVIILVDNTHKQLS